MRFIEVRGLRHTEFRTEARFKVTSLDAKERDFQPSGSSVICAEADRQEHFACGSPGDLEPGLGSQGRVPGGVIAEVRSWYARGVWWDQVTLRGPRVSGGCLVSIRVQGEREGGLRAWFPRF